MKRIAWLTVALITAWVSNVFATDEPVPDSEEASGYMDPDGSSPAAALNPAESGFEVWIGPILLGAFALLLIVVIRRFSRPRRQEKAQRDNPSDRG